MTISDEHPRRSGFLSRGFRPFFLGSAVLAALAVPLWALSFAGWLDVLQDVFTRNWHTHEMIFGYSGGVIGGFALTAVPNWTGRLPVAGKPLAGLFALWIIGRLALAAMPFIGGIATAFLDSAYFLVLAGYLLREIIAAGNLRNLPIAGMVSALALANVFWHISQYAPWDAAVAERCGLAVVALLITLVGGRVTPSFTHNWLKKTGRKAEMPGITLLDKAAMAVSAVGLALWVVMPEAVTAGVLMTVAGIAVAARLSRWRGVQTFSEPLVLILHIGYLWLAVSFMLLGSAALAPDSVDPQMALHALTTGAIGTMTLAVMTRASLGHTGAGLFADRATCAIYGLVTAGSITALAGVRRRGRICGAGDGIRSVLERCILGVCRVLRSTSDEVVITWNSSTSP